MRLILSFIFLFSFKVFGQEIQVPALNSPVMDLAGLLSAQEREDLSQFAYEINTNNGPQITILTVNDLQGFAIEDYSMTVSEKWKLGTKKAGNGILVLISKNDRKMRIEVGEGIEGEITDYDTAQFTRQVFPAYFRRGNYHGGLRLFMEDVAKRFSIKSSEENQYVRRVPPARQGSPLGPLLPFFVLVLGGSYLIARKKPVLRGVLSGGGIAGVSWFMMPGLGMLILPFALFGFLIGVIGVGNILMGLAMSGGGSRHRGGGGFGGGGGGWSGGGGGFSGGGSSGSW